MKQWKLLLAALLCVLLVCISVGALADEIVKDVLDQTQVIRVDNDTVHHKIVKYYHDFNVTTGESINPHEVVTWEAHAVPADLSKWHVDKKPTCQEKGQISAVCEICHLTVTKATDKVPCDGVPVAATPAECGKDGNIAYAKCRWCGKIYVQEGGAWVVKSASDVVIHINSDTHDFAIADAKEASCLEEGYVIKVCQYCGKHEVEKFAKLEHDYDLTTWKVIQAPTCANPGKYQYTCKNCGHLWTKDVDALGHLFKDGCLTALKGQPVGTKNGDGEVLVASTCTKEGTAAIVCSRDGCDVKKMFTIPAGHAWSAWGEDPTAIYHGKDGGGNTVRWACVDDLYYVRKCSICGATEKKLVSKAIGHSWIIVKLDEVHGIGLRRCANCGLEEEFHLTIGDNTLVNPETPTEETNTPITPDPTARPLDIEDPKGGEETDKPADPTEKPADPTEKPADPTEKPADPTEAPAPAPAPVVSQIEGRMFENELDANKAVVTVQNFTRGATYKLPLYDAYGLQIGTLVIKVDPDNIQAQYTVLDAAGKTAAIDDTNFSIRVYDVLSDAKALNENYWSWTPDLTLYAIDSTAANLQVYLVLEVVDF